MTETHEVASETFDSVHQPAKKSTPIPLKTEKSAKRLRNKGVWVKFPDRLGGIEMKLRPLSHPMLTAAAAAIEKSLKGRFKAKKGSQSTLTAEGQLEKNRQLALRTIIACRNTSFDLGGQTVMFTGGESEKKVRDFFGEHYLPIWEKADGDSTHLDTDFLETLLDLNYSIDDVPLETIQEQGEDYMLGAKESIDFSD